MSAAYSFLLNCQSQLVIFIKLISPKRQGWLASHEWLPCHKGPLLKTRMAAFGPGPRHAMDNPVKWHLNYTDTPSNTRCRHEPALRFWRHVHVDVLSVAVSFVGKLFVTAAYDLLFLYVCELFPTPLRSSALGTSSSIARLVTALAPLLLDLSHTAAFLVFGTVRF